MYNQRIFPLLILFVVLAGLGAATMLTPAQAAAPTLMLIAPAGPQPPNAAVDVEVRVANATNLGAFEFDLEYDPALVQVTGITLRDLLGQATAGCDPHARRCAIALGPRAQANATSVGAYSYGTGAGTNGDGVLAVLHLQTTSHGGTASLHLANALITDAAANPATPATQDGTVQIQLADTSAPIITPTVVGTAGAGGWYRSAVTVSWGVSDPESGIASSSGCGATSLATPTAGTTLTCSATNGVGLSQTASVTIKIDTTPPSAPTAHVTPSPNAAGWNRTTPVTISFTSNGDAGTVQSGVASCSSSSLTAQTAGTVVTGACTDLAGNTSAQTAVTVKIDTTPPIVKVTGVTQGANYTLGAVPAAGCTTTDALAGVATAATLGVTGGTPNRVGTFTATCSGALDKAGNIASASVTYTVIYKFSGFFAPVNNLPKLNNAVAGLPIPVIFSLGGAQGLNVFASGYPKSQTITCGSTNLVDGNEATVPISPGGFVYVPGVKRYVYLWQTKRAWAGTCRQFVMKLNDGTLHRANFRFVK